MKHSAGILLFRKVEKQFEFFLVHPGGPFFTRKDNGWWTVPKGEIMPHEEPLQAAIREFKEETGKLLSGDFRPLQAIVQKGGKRVACWAIEGEIEITSVISNTFQLHWPPGSGKKMTFPEIDKAAWFPMTEAREKINERQISFLEQVIQQNSDITEGKKRP
jgi:predicted NUDIX family NTP pyrophosphohydrolase